MDLYVHALCHGVLYMWHTYPHGMVNSAPLHVLRLDPTSWSEPEGPNNSQIRFYSHYPNMKDLMQKP
jgi:hypothetical protein